MELMKVEAPAAMETTIYIKGIQFYQGRDRHPNPSVRWSMIRDSDLHQHHHHQEDPAAGEEEDDFHLSIEEDFRHRCVAVDEYCGVHKALGSDARFLYDLWDDDSCSVPLPCGDFRDWVSDTNTTSTSGAAMVAIPSPSSSSSYTIYMIGGMNSTVVNGAPLLYSYNHQPTEQVFYKEISLGGEGGDWIPGPPLIKARSGAQSVFFENRIYVFGAYDRKLERGPDGEFITPFTPDWSPWAEVLDLQGVSGSGNRAPAWRGLSNPPKELGNYITIDAHCILGRKFLLYSYSAQNGHILSYDPAKDSYQLVAKDIGPFYTAAFLDGLLYGVTSYNCDTWPFSPFTLYYFDVGENSKARPGGGGGQAKPLVNLEQFRAAGSGPLMPGGLIPVGRDLLYICTSKVMFVSGRELYKVYVFKYRFTKRTIDNSNREVEATLESKGSFFFHDVDSIEACLCLPSMNTARGFLKRNGRRRRQASKNMTVFN